MYSVIMIAMIIAIAVGAGACPMNLTLIFLLFIIAIHIIAGIGNDSTIFEVWNPDSGSNRQNTHELTGKLILIS